MKGDQLRAFSWISELAQRHDVRVVTAGRLQPGAPRLPPAVDIAAVGVGPLERACSALGAGATGAPFQVGWMMPRRAWRAAMRAMPQVDVVLAVTTRSLRGPVPVPLVIDHVDALSLNMERRARGEEPWLVRRFARLESARFRAWEQRSAHWAEGAFASAAEDAAALPQRPPVDVIASGLDEIDPAWITSQERPIDVVLSGNMRYPPNRRAAQMLDAEIFPALRERVAGVRVVVVGRGADTLALQHVEVMSDVPDMFAVLRRAKVAIAPLELGTGSPNKVLEAAACGAAIVSSPWAAARFGIAARTASDAAGYCAALHELLSDPAARAAMVAESQPAVEQHRSEVLARRVEALLLAAVEGREHNADVPPPGRGVAALRWLRRVAGR